MYNKQRELHRVPYLKTEFPEPRVAITYMESEHHCFRGNHCSNIV